MDQNSIIVNILDQGNPLEELRFNASFCIGRSKGCDLVIRHEAVSRKHVLVEFAGEKWFLKDLESGNGTFIDGVRVQHAELAGSSTIELGQGGPQISLQLEVTSKAPEQKKETEAISQPQLNDEPVVVTVPLSGTKADRPEFATETQVIQHYLASENAGEQTMMIRRAFDRNHKQKSLIYKYLIALGLLLLTASGGFIQMLVCDITNEPNNQDKFSE